MQLSQGKPDGQPDRNADLALLSGLDLNLLAPLHALVEERSVTRAAVRVGLTQSAMSHLLRRCRLLFSDELLTRVGANMELTARARELQAPLAMALESIREIVDPAAGFVPLTTNRKMSIAGLNSSTATILPKLLDILAEHAPNLTLKLVGMPAASENLVDRPDIDLLLRSSTIPSQYQRMSLYEERWVVVVDADNPVSPGSLTLDDLLSMPHVQYESEDSGVVMPYRVLEGMGVSWRTAAAVNDFLIMPHLVRRSDRIAIVQERVARDFASGMDLRIEPLPFSVGEYTVDLIWNPRRYYDPLKTWFTLRLKEAMDAQDHSAGV